MSSEPEIKNDPEAEADSSPSAGQQPPREEGTPAEASAAAETQDPPPEPELLDSVPVLNGKPLAEAAKDGQLLEACPSCGTLMDVTTQEPFAKIHCPSCGQALRARKQFNHFKLLALIGQGGMGQVFRAEDCNLNRLVALKVLKKELAASEEERLKLAEEARITASINHPHVVKVFSFGDDHGQFYMAMELIPNASLDELLSLQKRVPEIQALQIGIQIAEGLKAALDKGLIHRDIKPGNILFADAHTVKLVDFGLAIIMDQAAAAIGEIWGTPYYIAPEKLDNQPEDFRSDIYSLGGTLFHAIAGRPPYEAETASMVALKQLKSMPVSLQSFAPDVSSETAYVINRMIAKEADDRYASYDDLLDHLTYARDKLNERIRNPRQPKARVVMETKQTRNVAAWISLTLLVVILAALGTLIMFRKQIFPKLDNKPDLTFVAEDFYRDLSEGISLASQRQFDEAREKFRLLSETPNLPQPEKNWAKMNLGLATLLAGDRIASAGIFEAIANKGLYSNDESQITLAGFFVEVAKALSDPDKAYNGRLYNARDAEAFALLVFGMHNWDLGDLSMATPLFQSFLRARLSSQYQWISGYNDLVTPYAEDGRMIRSLESRAAAAKTPEAREALLPEVEKARESLQTGSIASEALERILEQLQKTQPNPP